MVTTDNGLTPSQGFGKEVVETASETLSQYITFTIGEEE